VKTIRIGAGAGYSGDRIEPAVELAERANLDYLVFECLAERTIALAQQIRAKEPEVGYDPLLVDRLKAVLPACRANGTKIITNMGAANPGGAAAKAAGVARELGFEGVKIAAVHGDDVIEQILEADLDLLDQPGRVADFAGKIVAANAYLGIGPIVESLDAGADIVITGRVSDPALFLAPMVYAFGWDFQDWVRLGRGTSIGHLLECAGQVSGGYFADPGFKDVPNLASLGFPFADVTEDGEAVIGKVVGSGGTISLQTCKEQLLYEVHDPAAYLQPDVIADFSGVTLLEGGPNRIAISGGTGRPRPATLKVTIAYRDSYVGEGQISYAGAGSLGRARLALGVIEQRLQHIGVATSELRLDLIGVNAVRRGSGGDIAEPQEVRARVVGRTETLHDAQRIGGEVESLWLNGPAGGGGAWKSAREVIAVVSTLLPRAQVHPHVTYEVS
jgi:hypothetical protein